MRSTDGIIWGNILIAFRVAGALCPLWAFAQAKPMYGLAVLLWLRAGLLFVLGVWMLSVSLIIREIRWMALEAAVARGDVVIP
ncbi:hypothetical protein HY2_15680 [Hyphomonas pacifica]|nr:hypothetical protein HY2_15680 [Hyphomonas pacifica]